MLAQHLDLNDGLAFEQGVYIILSLSWIYLLWSTEINKYDISEGKNASEENLFTNKAIRCEHVL